MDLQQGGIVAARQCVILLGREDDAAGAIMLLNGPDACGLT